MKTKNLLALIFFIVLTGLVAAALVWSVTEPGKAFWGNVPGIRALRGTQRAVPTSTQDTWEDVGVLAVAKYGDVLPIIFHWREVDGTGYAVVYYAPGSKVADEEALAAVVEEISEITTWVATQARGLGLERVVWLDTVVKDGDRFESAYLICVADEALRNWPGTLTGAELREYLALGKQRYWFVSFAEHPEYAIEVSDSLESFRQIRQLALGIDEAYVAEKK